MARSGVSCGLASGLACPLPSPPALSQVPCQERPRACVLGRGFPRRLPANAHLQQRARATGTARLNPTQPEIAAGSAEGTALSPHRPSFDRKGVMQTRGCWLSALPPAQHCCPKAPAPLGKPPAPLGPGCVSQHCVQPRQPSRKKAEVMSER